MSNNTDQTTNEVAIIENSIQVFRSAPEVLKANKERTAKALMVGNSVLDQFHKAWEIKDEDARITALAAADARANGYLVNCGNALKEEKELRAAITQLMDEFKKMFTAAENEIDKSKPNTIPSKVQNNRDTYAQESFKISERKRQEAEKEAEKKKEVITLKATVETRFIAYFNDHVLKAKQWLQGKFNALKLEGFADAAAEIRLYDPSYKENHFQTFNPQLYSNIHTKDELDIITKEVLTGRFKTSAESYKSQMMDFKKDLVDKIPSKHEELKEEKRLADEKEAQRIEQEKSERKRQEDLEKANAEQREALAKKQAKEREEEARKQAELKEQQEAAEREKKEREEAEAALLVNQTEQATKEAEQQIELNKQGEETMVLFEKEATLAESVQASKSRQGYEIVILHPVACTQIFALWFENEGKNLPVDKILTTKVDQMKTWAEKFALKTGTKIDSKFLRYDDSFKAVNSKK